ncbi:MAG TPA: hypothetical protein VI612_03055 [Candidatus Nanoarchaeia archaeon]|nr:hypothetical protein [Candidatus Nanoarchaeia archaeon]
MQKNKILLLLPAVFAVIFFTLYPSIPQISDESEYFRNAYLLMQGKTIINQEEYTYNYFGEEGRYFSRYPLTAGLFLIPFIILGLKSAFLFGLFFFLLGYYFFIKLLDHNKIDRIWALAYLGYTPFIFHSTTLMVDLPSAALLLGTFYFYAKRNGPMWGLLSGLSLLLKTTNIIAIAVLLVFSTIKALKSPEKKKSTITALLIISVFIAIMAAHNFMLFGSPLKSGYDFIHNNVTFLFSKPDFIQLFIQNITHYAIFLLLFYPLMLILASIPKYDTKKETLWYTAALIIFFSAANNLPSLAISDLIISYRYIFPAAALLLIGYVKFLNDYVVDRVKLLKKYLPAIIAIIALLLITASIPILDLKQQGSARTHHIVQDIYGNTEDNSLIIGVQEANYFNEYFGNRGYLGYLRPTAFDDSEPIINKKIEEYFSAGKSVYLLYFETPYYSYKKGVEDATAKLDLLKEKHNGTLVYENSYPVRSPFYTNTMSFKIYKLSA